MLRRRRGFTLIELLIVIAIIGILIASIAVAVTRAKEYANRMACANNLRNIGTAMRVYSERTGFLPPGRIDYDGGATWVVHLWPYIEQESLFKRWNINNRYYVQSAEVRQAQLGLFYCPSRRSPRDGLLSANNSKGDVPQSGWPSSTPCPGALGDYAACQGNNGDFYDASKNPDGFNGPNARGAIILGSWVSGSNHDISSWSSRTRLMSITDGPSNTFLVGEKHVQLGTFGIANNGGFLAGDGSIYNGDPGNLNACRVAGTDGVHASIPLARSINEPVAYQFGSWHPGLCNFVFGDASVKAIKNEIDDETLGRFACRDDGQPIEYGW